MFSFNLRISVMASPTFRFSALKLGLREKAQRRRELLLCIFRRQKISNGRKYLSNINYHFVSLHFWVRVIFLEKLDYCQSFLNRAGRPQSTPSEYILVVRYFAVISSEIFIICKQFFNSASSYHIVMMWYSKWAIRSSWGSSHCNKGSLKTAASNLCTSQDDDDERFNLITEKFIHKNSG